MQMLTNEEIKYIECMCRELVKNLKNVKEDLDKEDHYIFSSPNRAKFKRLRIELSNKLMEVQKQIY